MEEFKSKLKTNKYGKTLTPIKDVLAKDLKLSVTPKEDMEKVTETITDAVVSILGYNPIRFYGISKDMLIDDIAFDTHSFMTRIQKISIPLDEKFVERLISCEKVLAKIKHVHKKESDKTMTDEIRMILIGKLDGQYIPFQLNYKRETVSVNGKLKSILKSSLGVVLGGKNYVNIERYDPSQNHQNLFYDQNKHLTENKASQYIRGGAHLHYTNKRAFISLFDVLQHEGYSPEEILQSHIMSKQEGIPFQTFNNCDEAKNFFFKRYNVKMDFKNMPQRMAKAGKYFEVVSESVKRKEEAKAQAQQPKQNKNDSKKANPKPIIKHKKIFVETNAQARISDSEIDDELFEEFGPDKRDFDLETMQVSYKPAMPQAKKSKKSIFHFETSEEAQRSDEEIMFEHQQERHKNTSAGKNRVNSSNNKKLKQKEARKNDGRSY